MKKATVVIDLGFGDAGKGTIVDYLARTSEATLVVRYNGGCQAAHNVVLPDGTHHTFAQFGSGYFAGLRTHLSRFMMVEPIALRNEALHLKGRPFDTLSVDPRALLTTPMHWEMNRWREKQRGNGRHGSCGRGIGETMDYHLNSPYSAPVVGDLQHLDTLYDKLSTMMGHYLPIISEFEWTLDQMIEVYEELRGHITLRNDEEVLPAHDEVIFEGAQGVLLDQMWGFLPYVTWSDTTGGNATRLIGGGVGVTRIGVTRSYMTRHGAGPFPTEADLGFDEPHNGVGEWQGAFRTGCLDLELLRYALAVTGPLDGLAITHMDRTTPVVCAGYDNVTMAELMDEGTRLEAINRAIPVYEPWNVDLGVPIYIQSSGPTWQDKQSTSARFSIGVSA